MPRTPGPQPPGPSPGYWEGGGGSCPCFAFTKHASNGRAGEGVHGSLMKSADNTDVGAVGCADVT